MIYMQEFNTHSDENDPERVQQIIERAMKDVEWIVNQVHKQCLYMWLDIYSYFLCINFSIPVHPPDDTCSYKL